VAPPATSAVSLPPLMLPPPPVLGPPDGTAVTVTVADAVTVAGAVTVAVTVPDGGGDGEPVPDVVGVNVVGVTVDAVGVGLGLWALDSIVACAAVPVSAITAALIARQPDARLMRIAISRSCSPDRSVTVMPVTDHIGDHIGDRSVGHKRISKMRISKSSYHQAFHPANRI
jgi:hypothetical protein